MADPRIKTRASKRQTSLTMTPNMWAYVEAVRETGLYGDSTSKVLATLIAEGIRGAVKDGIIGMIKG